jgi:GDPmannose 4,6-dehydratase
MTRILKLEAADDFVVASGVLHTVRELAEAAFSALGLPWQPHVAEDASLFRNIRPTRPLVGDATRLREATGWRPTLDLAEIVRRMVAAEMSTRRAAIS